MLYSSRSLVHAGLRFRTRPSTRWIQLSVNAWFTQSTPLSLPYPTRARNRCSSPYQMSSQVIWACSLSSPRAAQPSPPHCYVHIPLSSLCPRRRCAAMYFSSSCLASLSGSLPDCFLLEHAWCLCPHADYFASSVS